MIKAIVFDLWNTLAYNKVEKNALVQMKELLGVRGRDLEEGFMLKKFEKREDAFVNLCNHLGIEPEPSLIRKLVNIWNPNDTKLYLFPDVLPVLSKLKSQYKLGVISNVDCFSISGFFEKGYDKLFDVILLSYETGILKPSPEVFRLVLERLGTKPVNTLMVGDSLKDDVKGAESVGMQAVLIKREFEFQPSHLEKGIYGKMIRGLNELEKYLG